MTGSQFGERPGENPPQWQRAIFEVAQAGARIRAVDNARTYGALAELRGAQFRSAIFLANSGPQRTAAQCVAEIATRYGRGGLPVQIGGALPTWAGALDVVVVAADDCDDPEVYRGVEAAEARGCTVVIDGDTGALFEGSFLSRTVVLPDVTGVGRGGAWLRRFAVALAVVGELSHLDIALGELADLLDEFMLTCSLDRDEVANPAKAAALALDEGIALFTAENGLWLPVASAIAAELSEAGRLARAVGVREASVIRAAYPQGSATEDIFYDPELDGPAPSALRAWWVGTTASAAALPPEVAADLRAVAHYLPVAEVEPVADPARTAQLFEERGSVTDIIRDVIFTSALGSLAAVYVAARESWAR